MSNTLFVVLPSNTKGYAENRNNKFRVHLPYHLEFHGTYVCGLHSIIFPHTWATLGTTDDQYLDVYLKNGAHLRSPVPRSTFLSPEELENSLYSGLLVELEKHLENIEKNVVSRKRRSLTEHGVRKKRSDEAVQNLSESAATIHIENFNEKIKLLRQARHEKEGKLENANEEVKKTLQSEIAGLDAEISNYEKQIENLREDIPALQPAQKNPDSGQVIDNTLPEYKEHLLSEQRKEIQKLHDNMIKKRDEIEGASAETEKLALRKQYSNMLEQYNSAVTDLQQKESILKGEENTKEASTSSLPLPLPDEAPEKQIEEPPSDEKESEIINKDEKQSEQPSALPLKSNLETENSSGSSRVEPQIENQANAVKSSEGENEPTEITSPPPPTPARRPYAGLGPIFKKVYEEREENKKIRYMVDKIVQNKEIISTKTEDEAMLEEGPKVIFPVGMAKEEVMEIMKGVKFIYKSEIGRFVLQISNQNVEFVSPSPQLGYVLGYEEGQKIENKEVAKYSCDLRGGISHLCVYAPGLTENIIVGDTLSSLLRIVAVQGKPGDIIEKIYDSPIYSKVLPREIREICIEIRTLEGRLVPFDYGTILVVLEFRKAVVF